MDLSLARDAVRSRTGLLGHQNGLYLELTVRENLDFWGRTVGASPDEVSAAMRTMNVDGRLEHVRTARLSAGQKRRTALAALLIRRAELWLLDEPHAGLDAAGRDELDALLRDAVRAGATVIVSSHETERASSLATRIVTVDGGVVTEDGS